jgi:hypothetical protein
MIMDRLLISTLILVSIAFAPTTNAQITYTTTDVSGNTWDYNYTITNNTPINPIGEFTVFYTLGQYSNLMLESSPGNWSSIVAQPDAGLPADGFFDALALDSGLATGNTATGFTVQFTYLGQGTPGSQPFNIVDPNTFQTLSAGNTTRGSVTMQAPEIDPVSATSALTLLFGGLAVIRARKCRKEIHP